MYIRAKLFSMSHVQETCSQGLGSIQFEEQSSVGKMQLYKASVPWSSPIDVSEMRCYTLMRRQQAGRPSCDHLCKKQEQNSFLNRCGVMGRCTSSYTGVKGEQMYFLEKGRLFCLYLLFLKCKYLYSLASRSGLCFLRREAEKAVEKQL